MNSNEIMADGAIDEALYSRQLYTLGADAMRKMVRSSVLVVGLGGLGVEVAKNVILSGAKLVSLYDREPACWTDLSAQFYLSEEDVKNGNNRAKASFNQLNGLNPYVKLDVYEGVLSEEYLKNFTCVIITEIVPEMIEISEICHKNGIKFILATVAGLAGRVFCDFGENFFVNDLDGEDAKDVNIKSISLDKIDGKYGIYIMTETFHNLSSDDKVSLSDVKGAGNLMEILNSDTPRKIIIKDRDTLEIILNDDEKKYLLPENNPTFEYLRGGILNQIKPTKTISFKSYLEARKEPKYPDCLWDTESQDTLHKCFEKYQELVISKQQLPRSYNEDDAMNFAVSIGLEKDNVLATKFAKTCKGNINAICAFIGGWAAQEVLKSVSGKYTPTTQFLYYEDFRAIPKHPDYKPTEENTKPLDTRYDGNIILLGKPYQEKLHRTNLFLIGAGALGCELLKQFALYGLATEPGYEITVTDNDNIEKSNLSRQFLFRNTDVGRSKSEAATDAVKKMNKNINIRCLKLLVANESMNTFNAQFWLKQDLVCNAVDNIKARLFIDEKCVYYGRPLIDSGTLGPKANTQVVIPNLTESYGSSRDPDESSFPLCTIHQFPYNIQHTIAWAKDVFGGLFEVQPRDLKTYLENHEAFIQDAIKEGANGGTRVQAVAKLLEDAPKYEDINKDWIRALTWARLLYEDYFVNKPKCLLYKFPLDSKTETGEKFWIGSKRPPTPVTFDAKNPLHMDFVYSGAKIFFDMFGLQPLERNDERDATLISNNVVVPECNPALDNTEAAIELNVAIERLNKATQMYEANAIQKRNLIPDRIEPIEFEKDDETNGHVDFINATSNIRAINYEIEPVTKTRTKFIAGRIIPAMITTTALIVGLVGVEIVKVIDYSKFGFETKSENENEQKLLDIRGGVENFSCIFINLALTSYIPSDPIECTYRQIPGIPGKLSLWSFIDVDSHQISSKCTLKELVEYITDKYKMDIMMMTFGPSMLWQSFGDNSEKENLPIEEALKLTNSEEIIVSGVAELVVVADPICSEEEMMDMPEDGYDYPVVRVKL